MEFFGGIIGLICIILWLVAFSRLGEIRDEAQKQTRLLEQIAPRPPPDYMRDPPAPGLSLFLFIAATLAAVLIVILLASR